MTENNEKLTINKKYLNKTMLKEKYYFSDKNIKELLPEPKIVNNPYYKKINMYLWKKEDVDAIIENEDVKIILKKNKIRKEKFRASIEKTYDRKRELTKKQYIDAAKNIRVIVISLKDLRTQTLNHIRNFRNRNNNDFNPEFAKEENIKRWEVNYIRHQLTRYDDLLEIGFGKIGKSEAQKILIEAIYKKIASSYPSLKDECERQLIEHLNRWDLQI